MIVKKNGYRYKSTKNHITLHLFKFFTAKCWNYISYQQEL